MAIGLDKSNANIEAQNLIKSWALKKIPIITLAMCLCHIPYSASCKASKAFSLSTEFDITDHCVDLFYWFDRSSKRTSILKKYYGFCDMEYAEVIKLVSFCCLCLEMCVNRELKKFPEKSPEIIFFV